MHRNTSGEVYAHAGFTQSPNRRIRDPQGALLWRPVDGSGRRAHGCEALPFVWIDRIATPAIKSFAELRMRGCKIGNSWEYAPAAPRTVKLDWQSRETCSSPPSRPGICARLSAATRSRCNSSPLKPGMRTSSTRHSCASLRSLLRNSAAVPNVSTLNFAGRINRSVERQNDGSSSITKKRSLRFRSWHVRILRGKGARKDHAGAGIRRRPEASAVRIHDRSADAQAHPPPLGLRGKNAKIPASDPSPGSSRASQTTSNPVFFFQSHIQRTGEK